MSEGLAVKCQGDLFEFDTKLMGSFFVPTPDDSINAVRIFSNR